MTPLWNRSAFVNLASPKRLRQGESYGATSAETGTDAKSRRTRGEGGWRREETCNQTFSRLSRRTAAVRLLYLFSNVMCSFAMQFSAASRPVAPTSAVSMND